jgi:hypothetical protein
MTLSVPSFLAAATSLLSPFPAEAVVAVDQLVPLLELGEELGEHPATSNARAVSPMSANRCGDLTRMPPAGLPIPIAAVPEGRGTVNIRK